MRKLFLVLMAFLMLCVPLVSAVYCGTAECGNTTTLYHNITAAIGAQTDYQVKFILSNSSGVSGYYAPDNIIYTSGTTRPDWYDINFTSSTDAPLPFWVENNTYTAYNATAWVKISTIAVDNSSTTKVGYGNAGQSASTMNGYATFPLFDDFIGSAINTSQWNRIFTGGSNAVSGGVATVTGGGAAWEGFSFATAHGINTSMRYRHYVSSEANHWQVGYGALNGTKAIMPAQNGGGQKYSTINTANTETARSTSYTSNIVVDLKRNGLTSNQFFENNILKDTHTTNLFSDSVYPGFYANNKVVYMDWVLVRKSTPTEPTTSLYTTTESSAGNPISASFTHSVNPSIVSTAVTFTDTSTGIPTTWNWTIEGVVTNTTQNAAYTFTSAGTYPITLNVTNASGYFSEVTQNQVVGNVSSFTQQDIWMDGNYLQTFIFTDSDTGLSVSNVTVTASNGGGTTTTNGTAYMREPYGIYVFSFQASGYNLRQDSYVVDQDEVHAITLTKAATESSRSQTIQYVPHLVRFIVKDYGGQPVSDVTVYAQGTESTASDNWILALLGIDMTEIPMANTTLTGTTGTDGSIVFMMLETVQYTVNFTSVSSGVSEEVRLYPKEESYLVLVGTTAMGDSDSLWGEGSASITHNLTSNQTGTKLYLNLSYIDTEHGTTSIFFYVEDGNRTPIYNTTYAGHSTDLGYVVDPFAHGMTYYYGYTAAHSTYGTLSGNSIVTTHSRLLAPLEYLGWDTSWYMWITVIALICFAALFSGTTNVYGTLLLPFWSLLFGYIGWLDWCPWEFLVGVAILGTLAFISKMYARVSDG